MKARSYRPLSESEQAAQEREREFVKRIQNSPAMRAHHEATREISDSRGTEAVETEARWCNQTGLLLP